MKSDGYGQHMMKWRDRKWLIGYVIVPTVLALVGWIYFKSSSPDSLGSVQENRGIITQGQTGNNIINNLSHHSFSATERIIWAPGGNQVLHLDHVAALTCPFPLLFSKGLLCFLDDVAVPVIPGSNVFKLSTSHSPSYQFYPEHVRNDIAVGGRNFIVTLTDINNINIPGVANPVEYVFEISEK